MKLGGGAIKDTIVNFLIPIVCVLVSAGVFLFYVYPSFSEIPVLEAEIAEKRTLQNQLTTKLADLNRLLDFKTIVDQNAALLDGVLVSEPNVPLLLTQIDTIANESGLEVSTLSYAFSSNRGSSDSVNYDSVNVALGAKGNYQQISAFLNSLETSARLVNVDSIRYSESNSEEDSGLLNVSFVLTSPYLEVPQETVTDAPISVDVTDEEFIALMDKLKVFRYFRTDLTSAIVDLALEEGPASTLDIDFENVPAGTNPDGSIIDPLEDNFFIDDSSNDASEAGEDSEISDEELEALINQAQQESSDENAAGN